MGPGRIALPRAECRTAQKTAGDRRGPEHPEWCKSKSLPYMISLLYHDLNGIGRSQTSQRELFGGQRP